MKPSSSVLSVLTLAAALALFTSACGNSNSLPKKPGVSPQPNTPPTAVTPVADSKDSAQGEGSDAEPSDGAGAGEQKPVAGASPTPGSTASPGPQATPGAENTLVPMTEACLEELKDAKENFLKRSQLIRLRGRLEALLAQVAPESMAALAQPAMSLEQARAIYLDAAKRAKINLEGSYDKLGRISLSWSVLDQPKVGGIVASFKNDSPGMSFGRLQGVYLGYVPGEKSYRLGWIDESGKVSQDLAAQLLPQLPSCKGVQAPAPETATLEATIAL